MSRLTLREDFAVFILSHGRAKKVQTLATLEKSGYSGKIYIIVSDDDPELEKYKQLYSDILITFSREEASARVDSMDNQPNYRGVIYARNSCFKIAQELGIRYFLELDDDYNWFGYRFEEGNKLASLKTKRIDEVIEATLRFLDESGAMVVAWAQGGDYIGGVAGGGVHKKIMRKAMNSFFCDVQKPFDFIGRINEDTNMYVHYGMIGQKIFTVTNFMLGQATTQKNENGMTNLYLDYGTYLKSFYSVMLSPSSVKLMMMGDKHKRIHHKVDWNRTTPKIISERYKKR